MARNKRKALSEAGRDLRTARTPRKAKKAAAKKLGKEGGVN